MKDFREEMPPENLWVEAYFVGGAMPVILKDGKLANPLNQEQSPFSFFAWDYYPKIEKEPYVPAYPTVGSVINKLQGFDPDMEIGTYICTEYDEGFKSLASIEFNTSFNSVDLRFND